MARKQGSGKTTEASVEFGWSHFWSWFTSSLISDVERKETYSWFLKYDILEGMTPDLRFEVLEYAPDPIVKHQVRLGKIPQSMANEILSKRNVVSGQPQAAAETTTALSYRELLAQLRR